MASLQIDFLGMQFPNPFMLASAPPTRNSSMVKRAFRVGWGGAVTKTVSLNPVPDVQPRLHPLQENSRNIGMENIELVSRMTVEEWQKELSAIKSAFPGRPLWASILAGTNREDWQRLVSMLEETGIDAFAAINTVSGIVGVDLDTLHPLPAVNGETSYGGYSGPGIKPIALRCIAQIAKATGIPVSGLGGINKWSIQTFRQPGR